MTEIQEDYHKRIEEKMKKIYDSTDIIKKIEEKRIEDIEEKKMEKYEVTYENNMKSKNQLNSKKTKDQKRFEDVKYNYSELQKEMERKNKELSNKLKKKVDPKIFRHNISNNEEMLTKRQTSMERFMQNMSDIKKNKENKNLKFLKLQQERNARSFDKITSLNMSKENIR